MKAYRIAALMVLLLGVGLIVFAGTQLLGARQIYQEGNIAYEALSNRVKESAKISPKAAHASPATFEENTPDDTKMHTIDFETLKMINKDAAAWLYSPGTVIDYPIMKADDYSYYLNHLPDGTVNANGSLFIDYNCAADFSDPLTVIYGHHMKTGKMFGSLKGYKNQKYYEEHPIMYLYTEQGDYQVELVYGCLIGAGQWRDRAFMCEANLDALMAYAKHNTTFISATAYTEGDRIIALSTCSYEFTDARLVVLARIIYV